jgi:hypothetical protein
MQKGAKGKDIVMGALMGGTIGLGAYHASLAHSYFKSGFNETGLNYHQYAKMMVTTQRPMFYNREAKCIPTIDGGFQ